MKKLIEKMLRPFLAVDAERNKATAKAPLQQETETSSVSHKVPPQDEAERLRISRLRSKAGHASWDRARRR